MHCYGDEHRLFLQIMLNRKILSLSELKTIITFCHETYKAPFDLDRDADAVKKFIHDMNTEMTPFHMRVKHGVSEDDGEHYYALVNLKDDDLSKAASKKYTENEIKFLKKLVEKVVDSRNGTVSSIEAINLTHGIERFSASDAESLIERFIHDKCLTEDQGLISLSTLSIMEMEPYLQNHFGSSLSRCHACKRICIKGQTCQAEDCEVKMHFHCAQKLFHGDTTEHGCPACGNRWRS
ncbi:non-structural maintenance of chromosomes element 1 homolog [Ornithodoros turicata]|uniref:non-structural maintenance of chromosomes element 1 homolog n=1 Tax=Ornithodoros turicata TaxID=34597 RepID=UPI003138CCAB